MTATARPNVARSGCLAVANAGVGFRELRKELVEWVGLLRTGKGQTCCFPHFEIHTVRKRDELRLSHLLSDVDRSSLRPKCGTLRLADLWSVFQVPV